MDKAPDAFRTISEVADELDIPQHVLRFWETRFTQIKPMKRSGGRRFYRPDDVDLLRGIRRLLYAEGYTIRGVQRILKEQGIKAVQGIETAPRVEAEAAVETPAKTRKKPAKSTPLPELEPEEQDVAQVVAEADATDDLETFEDEEADETSIVVSPPIDKPFTTPLPSIELRRSSVPIGMVPRSAMPPEVERPPKIPPVAPPPSYLPDITFDTSMPVPRRLRTEQAPEIAGPPPVPVREPEPVLPTPPPPPPVDARRLRPVLEDLMAVRRLLDAAMQGDV